MNTYLVCYYDGNEDKAGIIVDVDQSYINELIKDECDNFMITSVMELHHDYLSPEQPDWIATMYINGEWRNIRELPIIKGA